MRPAVRKSTLPTYLLTYNQFTTTHMFPCSFERWVSRTRCSKWTPARRRSKRHLWHPLQSTRRWKRQSRTFSRISKQNRCSRGGSLCGSWSCSSPCGSCKDTHPPTWHKELTVYSINDKPPNGWAPRSPSSARACFRLERLSRRAVSVIPHLLTNHLTLDTLRHHLAEGLAPFLLLHRVLGRVLQRR